MSCMGNQLCGVALRNIRRCSLLKGRGGGLLFTQHKASFLPVLLDLTIFSTLPSSIDTQLQVK